MTNPLQAGGTQPQHNPAPVQQFSAGQILNDIQANNQNGAWFVNELKQNTPQADQMVAALAAHAKTLPGQDNAAKINGSPLGPIAMMQTAFDAQLTIGARIFNAMNAPVQPQQAPATPAEYKAPLDYYADTMALYAKRETTILASLEYTLPVVGALPRLAMNVVQLVMNLGLASYHGAASLFDRFEAEISGQDATANPKKMYHREHAKFVTYTLAYHNIANIARALTVMVPVAGQAFAIIADNVLKMRLGYENEVTSADVFRLDNASESWASVKERKDTAKAELEAKAAALKIVAEHKALDDLRQAQLAAQA